MEKDILIVDDEKNIRLTLSQTLESTGLAIDTAVNGEDAMEKIARQGYRLVLLDLKMPGIGGMELLRRISGIRPEIRFIIITAHGSIDSAVEAMKLGAVDFLQKPFSPGEIRELVRKVLDRENLDEKRAAEYDAYVELAKKSIGERRFSAAEELLRKAVSLEPKRPEVFNLLGALTEMKAEREKAIEFYRTAYWIDPSYEPSRENLERLTGSRFAGFGIDFGTEDGKPKTEPEPKTGK